MTQLRAADTLTESLPQPVATRFLYSVLAPLCWRYVYRANNTLRPMAQLRAVVTLTESLPQPGATHCIYTVLAPLCWRYVY